MLLLCMCDIIFFLMKRLTQLDANNFMDGTGKSLNPER